MKNDTTKLARRSAVAADLAAAALDPNPALWQLGAQLCALRLAAKHLASEARREGAPETAEGAGELADALLVALDTLDVAKRGVDAMTREETARAIADVRAGVAS